VGFLVGTAIRDRRTGVRAGLVAGTVAGIVSWSVYGVVEDAERREAFENAAEPTEGGD
jgi:hypothetical protein